MSNKIEKTAAEAEKPTIETNTALNVEPVFEIEAVNEERAGVIITTFVGEQLAATINEAV